MTECCTTPEWQTAIATWAIFAVTLPAAIVGGVAAVLASRSYALEAKPVIVIREARGGSRDSDAGGPIASAPLYVVAPNPTVAEGVILRMYEAAKDDPMYGKSGVVPYGSAPRAIGFIVQNVGRSPAIDVVLRWRVETPIFDGKPDFENIKTRKQVGKGEMRIMALSAQQRVSVEVENYLGNVVTLRVEPRGSQVDWSSSRRKRKSIDVIADALSYALRSR